MVTYSSTSFSMLVLGHNLFLILFFGKEKTNGYTYMLICIFKQFYLMQLIVQLYLLFFFFFSLLSTVALVVSCGLALLLWSRDIFLFTLVNCVPLKVHRKGPMCLKCVRRGDSHGVNNYKSITLITGVCWGRVVRTLV